MTQTTLEETTAAPALPRTSRRARAAGATALVGRDRRALAGLRRRRRDAARRRPPLPLREPGGLDRQRDARGLRRRALGGAARSAPLVRRRYGQSHASDVTAGVGLASAYVTLLAATAVYGYLSPAPALALGLAIAATGVLMAAGWGARRSRRSPSSARSSRLVWPRAA